jgi:methylmalonyl-CoA mutase N-terminal domain/subunit
MSKQIGGDPTEREREWRDAYAQTAEREVAFETLSGTPVAPLYTEADVAEDQRIGLPGQPPFTRGVYASMYRGRLWTMRQFAGFGTAEETNERFHYLLDQGQTGLSTAFDMPSLMGYDSDSPRSLGEVGREGVAIDTLQDMSDLFAGIDLGAVSVSLTINAPAAIMLAFYVVAAELAAVAPEHLAGTIQADILKEYIAQKEWCFPVDPAMRLLGTRSSGARRGCRAGIRCRSAATTSARPDRPPRRSWPSRSRTASHTSSRRSSEGSTSTPSRRG